MEASALPVDTGILRAPGAPILLRLRSDEQLVALFRAGSEEAFGVICDRFQTRLLAYVRRMLPPGPRANAEDVLQDVYMRAYGALRADDRPVAVRAWLYRVAHNRCIDELRRPGAQPTEIVEQEGDPRLDPALAAERRENLRRLVADLGRLPEQQRSALLMRELEGFTYEELGATLGVTQPAVKSLLVRARVGLAEAAQARDTSCDDIHEDLAETRDRRVRTSARAKRHLRDCGECRSFDKALRNTSRDLGLLLPGPAGLFAMLAGLLGGGAGAGGGVAGGSGAAGVAGGGIATATAAKVAVVVCCVAATAGGAAAVKVEHALKHPAAATASTSAAPATARPAAPVETLPPQVSVVNVSDPVATPEQPATVDGPTTLPATDADGATTPATGADGATTGGLPGAGGSASPDEPADPTTADDAAAPATTTQTVPATGPAVTTTGTSTTAAPAGTPATTTQAAATATTATVAPAS